MPNCLSFLLMDIGNSLTVREDEPCCESVYAIGVCEHSVGCCFFLLTRGFPRTYQRRLSN